MIKIKPAATHKPKLIEQGKQVPDPATTGYNPSLHI